MNNFKIIHVKSVKKKRFSNLHFDFDDPTSSDLILTFSDGDIENKRMQTYLNGVDLIQLESTCRTKYVFLFNLVVGWRKKSLIMNVYTFLDSKSKSQKRIQTSTVLRV